MFCLLLEKRGAGPPAIMLSARGSQLEAARLAGKPASGTFTPREGSSLKLAGLDLSNAIKPQGPGHKKGVDTVPMISASGKKGEVAPWGCEPGIIMPTPRTPEQTNEVQKRHKRRTGPGEITIHWGMRTTSVPTSGEGYGVKSNKGESAAENFKSGQKFGIAEYVQSRGESIYHTVRMEPLGSSYSRNHVLPEETKKGSFPGFGKALSLDAFDAKECIFPRLAAPDTAEDKARYKRTHGSFDPGEPIDRNYAWPNKVRENQHFRFGATDTAKPGNLNSGEGAKNALTMDLEEDKTYPQTKVVNRTSEHYRQVANDQLGQSRNLLQGRPPVSPGHAYGCKSGRDNTHAGELMRGFYPPADQRPDADLGKCTVKGRRNFHTKRPFGVPSVRNDLEPPPHHRRSVASATNYGDDHSAFNLIYPEKFGFRGVSDNDFFVRRPADEMRSLLEGCGYNLEDQDFRMLWEDAVKVFEDEEPCVSLEVMLNILGHWMSVSGVKLGRTNVKPDDTLLPASEGLAMESTA